MFNEIKPPTKILVLISGSGSNLQSIIDACNADKIKGVIVGVISNVPATKGLERAKKARIPTSVVNHQTFSERYEFDRQLAKTVDSYYPDLIVLAGFMRILSKELVTSYADKMINIHPSLLPAYPGVNTHQRAIEAGETYAGATVHFVTSELDRGPGILQAKVDIHPEDTATDLAERVLAKEHIIFPKVIEWVCDGRITLDNGVVF
jgi:phosphoribosylglycinamide formyltransferase-1